MSLKISITRIRSILFIAATLLFVQQIQTQGSSNMTLLDQWLPSDIGSSGGVRFNDIWGYVNEAGNEFAIVGSAFFIHLVDVTDPTNATELMRIPGGQGTIWRDFKTYRDRIYAVSDNTSEGLIIIDASQLPDTALVTYQSEEYFSQCHNIFIDEAHGRLYVAGSNTQNNGLIVLDIATDPDNPLLITSDALPGEYIHDLYVKDHIVYASSGFNGIYIYDYSDVGNIRLRANLRTNGYNHSSWLTEDCRYIIYAEEVPAGIEMGVIDVLNLQQGEIELAHLFKFPLLAPEHVNVTPHNPYIIDTLLVVSYYEDGTQVFDIANPLSPQPLGYYDTHVNTSYRGTNGNWGTYPYLPSGNIISTDINNGLFILSLDNVDISASDYSAEFKPVNVEIDGSVDECAQDSVQLIASGDYNFYRWTRNGVEIGERGNLLLANESGDYQAFGLQGQCSVASDPFSVSLLEPIIPQIEANANKIQANPGSGSYLWLLNGVELSGDSSSIIIPRTTGYYQAKRTDENGCEQISDSLFYFVPKEINVPDIKGFDAVYDSNGNVLRVSIASLSEFTLNLNIYDIVGRSMFRSDVQVADLTIEEIDASQFHTGVYIVTIDNGKHIDSRKIFVP